MKCFLSTSCFRGEKLNEAIEKCGELSHRNVEISAPHPYETLSDLKNIFHEFVQNDYKFVFHNYFPTPKKSFVLNIASSDKKTIESCEEMCKSVIELSPHANSNLYGIHAGYLSKATVKEDGNFKFDDDISNYNSSLNNATSFVNTIHKKFKSNNINLIIENLFPSVSRRSSLFCDLNEIEDFMNLIPKDVGLLLDLGHLNISSNLLKFDKIKFLEKFLDLYGNRLLEVHISENNGIKDEHLALDKNSWQLEAISKIKKKKIKSFNKNNERVYCLEARNSQIEDLKKSLNLINEIIN